MGLQGILLRRRERETGGYFGDDAGWPPTYAPVLVRSELLGPRASPKFIHPDSGYGSKRSIHLRSSTALARTAIGSTFGWSPSLPSLKVEGARPPCFHRGFAPYPGARSGMRVPRQRLGNPCFLPRSGPRSIIGTSPNQVMIRLVTSSYNLGTLPS